MDAATIGILGGMMTVNMMVLIYLDRARRADMKAGFAEVNQRFNEVGGRFDRQDERFDKRLDQQDERFDKRLDQQEARFDKRFDRQEARFDKRFDRVDGRLLHLIGLVVELARGVGEITGRVAVPAPVDVGSAAD